MFVSVGVVATALLLASIRAGPQTARRLAIETIGLAIAVVVVEVALVASMPGTWSNNRVARQVLDREQLAHKLQRNFDSRTHSEVVQSLRETGVDAVPRIDRGWARLPEIREQLGGDFYPLSQASNATVVECNEGGEYLVYRTDEYGFNNPQGLLASRRVDIAIVGESHALGHCVAPGHGVVDVIRRAYPRTANLGLADTRPLSQLATLREYVEPLRPPVVLWVVNPGFAVDAEEARDPILARYFDPSFSQHLIQRQDEVDAAVRALSEPLQIEHDRALRMELARARADRFTKVPQLTQVRQRLSPKRSGSVKHLDLANFSRTLQLASRATSSWGGQLVAVVLPSYGHLLGERPEVARYAAVMDVLRAQGLPVIDGAAVFLALEDPARVYTFGSGPQPNAAGHDLLARHILAELRRLHVVPHELEQVDVDRPDHDANRKGVRTGVRTAGEVLSVPGSQR